MTPGALPLDPGPARAAPKGLVPWESLLPPEGGTGEDFSARCVFFVPPAGVIKFLLDFFPKKSRVQPVGHYPYSRAVRGSIECGRALPLPA
ncbi:hypothetical protein D7X33_02765 [Butyricicoccus sp. 1XD8-22]|nr:hypothetical protein D7X33_02765 [Butyricicoccus sp. 1XD8-22]